MQKKTDKKLKLLNLANKIKKLDKELLVLLIFNLLFFYNPIFNNKYISSSDILQRFVSFNLGKFYFVNNTLLFDQTTQFIPWIIYAKKLFFNGIFPLWNNLNGGGVPLIANMQSALLFPLSFLYYIFEIRISLILVPFLKLYLIGLFSYLYLKEIGLKKYPSLLGSIAFNFSGFNILWLYWPQTNEIIFLPLLLYLCEKIIKKNRYSNIFIIAAISILLLILGGHPETATQILFIALLYMVYRIYIENISWTTKLYKLLIFLLSIIVGTILSSFQLFPFIEYLFNSYAFYQRTSIQTQNFLPLKAVILNFIPNLFGNPATNFYRPISEITNYNETNGGYVGLIILILAFLSIIVLIKKDKLVKFYVLLLVVLIPFIYNIPFLNNLYLYIVKYIPTNRFLSVVAFSLSVLLAKFINFAISKKIKNRNYIFVILIILIYAALSVHLIHIFGPKLLVNINASKANQFLNYLDFQIIYLSITSVVAFIVLILINYKKKISSLLLLILALLIFLQTGYLNINYNSSIKRKYFFPENTDIKFLENLPKGKILSLGGNIILPANVNLVFGVPAIDSYDALENKNYKILYDYLFSNHTSWDAILSANSRDLDLFGVKYVLSDLSINKIIYSNQINAQKLAGEIVKGKIVKQTFKSDKNNLMGIILLFANYNRINNCNLNLSLFDNFSNILINSSKIECKSILDGSFLEINFPPINDSKGRIYRFEIKSDDGKTGNAVSVWVNNDNQIVHQTIYNYQSIKGLNLIHKGKFNIYENNNGHDFYFVTKSLSLDEDKALKYIKSGKIDLNNVVILNNASNFNNVVNKNIKFINKIKIIDKNSNYIKMYTLNNMDSFLVSTNAYYPGWIAKIDGKESKIIKSNYAFYSIFVPKGNHKIEFVYMPKSFIFGLIVSFIAVILIILIKFTKLLDRHI